MEPPALLERMVQQEQQVFRVPLVYQELREQLVCQETKAQPATQVLRETKA